MRKAISLLLALVLCLSLCACGGGNETPATTEANTEPIPTTPTTPPTTETTAPVETEPQYETVEITMDNWMEYFEIRLVAAELVNAFGEADMIGRDIRFCLKEMYSNSIADIDVAVECSCTDGYRCWFSYYKQTGEIIEGEKVDYSGAFAKPVINDCSNIFAINQENHERGASILFPLIYHNVEWEENIATFEDTMYSNIEIVRIQGTITIIK